MANKLVVAPAPHVQTSQSTARIMRDVVIALMPALVVSTVVFGLDVLRVTALSVVSCVVIEYLIQKFMVRGATTVGNWSAVVTGVLLAFNLPASIPWWIVVMGAFVAIAVAKMTFGGLGKNFINPALGGRAFLMLSYPVAMTTWAVPGKWSGLISAADAVTGATPLSVDFMHSGTLPDASILDMFVGNVGGCIGEVSAVMLLAGGIYLIARGVIRPNIPVAFIATVAVLTILFPQGGNDRVTWMLYELLGGGLFLGAFFMATDYVTSPTSPKGEIVFGIGCGLLTVFIRYFGGYPEGVSYAILIMNVCAWFIDQVVRPARFGFTKEMKEKAKAAKKAAKEGASK